MNLIRRALVDRDIRFEGGLPCPLCGFPEGECECDESEAEDES